MTPYCKVLPKHFFGYANSIFLFNFKQFLRKKFFLKLELFIEPLDKVQKKKKKNSVICFCWESYLTHQAIMAHIVWYSENIKEKKLNFI